MEPRPDVPVIRPACLCGQVEPHAATRYATSHWRDEEVVPPEIREISCFARMSLLGRRRMGANQQPELTGTPLSPEASLLDSSISSEIEPSLARPLALRAE